ncbi:MAG: hypothetical protein AVDCRST_MAG35-1247, partial [uncultured Quadrisphaera sp.]
CSSSRPAPTPSSASPETLPTPSSASDGSSCSCRWWAGSSRLSRCTGSSAWGCATGCSTPVGASAARTAPRRRPRTAWTRR